MTFTVKDVNQHTVYFAGLTQAMTDVTIPQAIKDNVNIEWTVTGLDWFAFSGSSLTSSSPIARSKATAQNQPSTPIILPSPPVSTSAEGTKYW